MFTVYLLACRKNYVAEKAHTDEIRNEIRKIKTNKNVRINKHNERSYFVELFIRKHRDLFFFPKFVISSNPSLFRASK